METTLFEVHFYDGSKFRVFCYGKAQKKRFYLYCQKHVDEIKKWCEPVNGIHTIAQFEKRPSNKLKQIK
jgi:hypothetical protein